MKEVLTEDLLVSRFGFEKRKQYLEKKSEQIGRINYYYKNGLEIFIDKYDNNDYWQCVFIYKAQQNCGVYRFLTYVEELENIYFFITNEKLTNKNK